LRGRMAQDAALEGGVEGGKLGEVEGEAFGSGSATAANGAAGEDDGGSGAGNFGRPEGFFVAGKFGHLGEVVTEAGIPGFEERKELVANAVAGEGEMSVGRVFTPGLVEGAEIGFDFSAGGGEKRAEDAAFREFDDGVDAGEAFGPGAAEELGEDGFGLVVKGVGGGHRMERNIGEELSKPRIAEAAGGFFDGFGWLVGGGMGGALSGGVDLMNVKREVELRGESGDEGQVGVGFRTAQAVVEVGDMED